jgi:hypothetical protein
MCRNVATASLEHCIGYYSKGNEPEPIVMKIMVAPCVCGSSWWAKVPDGYCWVEVEKET